MNICHHEGSLREKGGLVKKLIITIFAIGMATSVQASTGDAALGALGGFAVGRVTAPRRSKTVVVQSEPEPRRYSRYDRVADLEDEIGDLRRRFDRMDRKLDQVLLASRK